MLNPDLFYELETIFGQVLIKNENEQAEYDYNEMDDKAIVLNKGRAKVSANVTAWGEVYAVNCPECGDAKHRLFFGHMLGQTLKRSGKDILFSRHMYKCHNEGCNVSDFVRAMDADAFIGTMTPKKVKNGILGLPSETTLPEGSIALSHAPLYVQQYLLNRGYDLDVLQNRYRVMFAPEGAVYVEADPEKEIEERRLFEDRLVIPIINKGYMISWQARVIGDVKRKSQPKYIFPPMFPKATAIYGIDEAWKYHTVVMEEGITDTWAYGPEAMACFGKSLSAEQIRYLEIMFYHQGRCCVVLDSAKEDPDTDEKSRKMVKKLQESEAFPDGVTEFRLPAGDPGGTDPVWLREQVEATFD
jgi:hypothetical protein